MLCGIFFSRTNILMNLLQNLLSLEIVIFSRHCQNENGIKFYFNSLIVNCILWKVFLYRNNLWIQVGSHMKMCCQFSLFIRIWKLKSFYVNPSWTTKIKPFKLPLKYHRYIYHILCCNISLTMSDVTSYLCGRNSWLE